ncbi:MAG: DNA polymerase III subunit gamma/tau [Chitinophagales bacterium]
MGQFIVSARKYRPKEFKEVVGQESITETLSRAITAEKIAQAFLFCGPRGVGKTTTARILAKAVNLGKIDGLSEEDEDFSFNIFELDAASNNKVEDMRNLMEQVRIPPQTGRYKIYIIDEVHMLSQAAFNAFLKTLEEPPPYAIFILATTEKHKILPTILSRCQIFDFKRISVPSIIKQLKHVAQAEQYEVEEEAYHLIAESADGALRDALSVFDRLVAGLDQSTLTQATVLHQLNLLDWSTFSTVTESLMTNDHGRAISLFNEVLEQGFEGDTFIQGLAEYIRTLLIAKDARLHSLMVGSKKKIQRASEQAELATPSFLINALALINDTEVSYQRALNKRLHVEVCLIRIAHASQVIEGEAIKKKTAELDTTPRTAPSPQSDESFQDYSTNSPDNKTSDAPEPLERKDLLEEVPTRAKEHERTEEQTNIHTKETTSTQPDVDAGEEDVSIESKSTTSAPITGKRLSLEDLDTEEILRPKTEKKTPTPEESVQKTAWDGKIESILAQVEEYLKQNDQQSVASILAKLNTSLEDDNLIFTATASAQRDFIETHMGSINNYIQARLSDAPTLSIVYAQQGKQEKKGVLQNAKKTAELMHNKNPAMRNFIDDLGLEIDYSA